MNVTVLPLIVAAARQGAGPLACAVVGSAASNPWSFAGELRVVQLLFMASIRSKAGARVTAWVASIVTGMPAAKLASGGLACWLDRHPRFQTDSLAVAGRAIQ